MEKGNRMDMDGFAAELEKEELLTLEPPIKRPCIGATPSDQDKENPSDGKEVEDPADDDDDDEDDDDHEEEEEEEDTDSSDEGEWVPPRPEMTEEEGREYRRQVAASKGFDVQRFKCSMAGGIQPYTLGGSYRRPLIDYSKHALQLYNQTNNTSFEFSEFVKANAQVVAGTMYYITFEALSGNILGTFHARVWKKIMNKGFEVMSIEKHSEKHVLATSL